MSFARVARLWTMSTPTTTRVSRIANVCIPVADQALMLDFYVDTLGLEKRVDVPFDENMRWIEVAPEGGDTSIALAPPPPHVATGNVQTGITLQTDDVDAYHAALKAAGVDVDAEVSRYGGPVPPMFWFRDPENNTLMVVEVK
jgi:catechol 2,3-dioxygenase-like lactoylglutathione lyase family enzyme